MRTICQIIKKYLLLALAVQALNVSFTTPENSTVSYTAVHYDQIDCALEFVTEHLLGWNNFLPECPHQSCNGHQAKYAHKTANVFLYLEKHPVLMTDTVSPAGATYPSLLLDDLRNNYREINPQPPRV